MKISVIIPVFNSELTITETISSVKKINGLIKEILIINDNSFDNTVKIIKKQQTKNNLIKLINLKKNYGVGYARNVGILNSVGEYLLFLDSDDKLNHTNFNHLIKKNINEKDIIYIGSKNNNHNSGVDKNIVKINRNKNFINCIKDIREFRLTCWNFIYKKKFLIKKNIRFPCQRIFEDQLFITKCIMSTNNFGIINKNLYIKNFNNLNSLSYIIGPITIKSCLSNITEFKEILEKNKNLKKKEIQFIKFRIIFFYNELIKNLLCENNIRNTISKYIHYNKKKLNLKKVIEISNWNKKIILKKIKNLEKFKNAVIFCGGSFAKILIQILKKNNIKINGIIDSFIQSSSQEIDNIKDN